MLRVGGWKGTLQTRATMVQVWISFMYVMFGIDVIDFQCQFLNLQYILCFIFEVGYDYI